jgi:hypothetical protein
MEDIGQFELPVIISPDLPFSNTPNVSPKIPPIVPHPSRPNTYNSSTHSIQQLLSLLFFLLRCCGKEFRSDDSEPEGGLDSDHESKTGVDSVADRRTRGADLVEEIER